MSWGNSGFRPPARSEVTGKSAILKAVAFQAGRSMFQRPVGARTHRNAATVSTRSPGHDAQAGHAGADRGRGRALQGLHRIAGNRAIQRAFDPHAWQRGAQTIDRLPNSSESLVRLQDETKMPFGPQGFRSVHLALLTRYFEQYRAEMSDGGMNPGLRTQKLGDIEQRIWSLLNLAPQGDYRHINDLLDLLDIVQAEQRDAFAELAMLAGNALALGPPGENDVREMIELGWVPDAGPDAKTDQKKMDAAWLWLSLFHEKSNIRISDMTVPLEPERRGRRVRGFGDEMLAMLGRLLASAGGRELIAELQGGANPVTIVPQDARDIKWAQSKFAEANDAISRAHVSGNPELVLQNEKQAEIAAKMLSNAENIGTTAPDPRDKNSAPYFSYEKINADLAGKWAPMRDVPDNPALKERAGEDNYLFGDVPENYSLSGISSLVRIRSGTRARELQFQGRDNAGETSGLFAPLYVLLAHELSHAAHEIKGQDRSDAPMSEDEKALWEDEEERQAVLRENLVRRALGQRARWPYISNDRVKKWHRNVENARDEF